MHGQECVPLGVVVPPAAVTLLRFCQSVKSPFKLHFSGSRIRLVYLDFSMLNGCLFKNTKLFDVVLAGARIDTCNFSGSDIVRCNFCGIQCTETLFDESDLYASRFIASSLNRIGFKDCNLKQVRFEHAQISEADFRYSNTEDAFFQKKAQNL